ncbi:protein kinase [Lentzea tibetensis]|uniref:Protein kinase n=1 Tax=Lentzea tibetensis TaxID=2591470 RepID=A0A563F2F9_9PSEU|nr:protein kinase [Lentzea tibetensis]TWP54002.1 protein kinase [Lentzea tibetensis]
MPMAADQAVRLVDQVAQAVQALHRAGVIHRDIKPVNVLLTSDGRALLTDFGVAEPPLDSMTVHGLTQDSHWLHSVGAPAEPAPPAGTYAYMAPEQWRGETVDARADVYGLGGLLFSALTASPPFTSRTLPELVYAVILSRHTRSQRDSSPGLRHRTGDGP